MKLYGKNPVIERLKSNPKSIQKIYIQERHPDEGYIRKKAQKWGISVYSVPRTKVQKIAHSLNTQGVVADIAQYPYTPYADILTMKRKKLDAIIFLDGLTDPQNFGAIIRSLSCLGTFALVLPTHKSVEVTETVLRVACGGENYLPIAKVANLNNAIKAAKEAGFWIVGTVVGEGEDLMATKLNFPLGLIIGSEQKGIRDITRKHLDTIVTIPMSQPRMSFNVAQAATVFGYEIIKQKKQPSQAAA